jgi:hypothetical protein
MSSIQRPLSHTIDISSLGNASQINTIVFSIENGTEILRIDSTRSAYHRGSLITTDKEIGDALHEWIDLMSVQEIMNG